MRLWPLGLLLVLEAVAVGALMVTWVPVDDSFRISLARTWGSSLKHACTVASLVPLACVAAPGLAWSSALTWVTAPKRFEVAAAVPRGGVYIAGVAVVFSVDVGGGATMASAFPAAAWVFIGGVVGVAMTGALGSDDHHVCCVQILWSSTDE